MNIHYEYIYYVTTVAILHFDGHYEARFCHTDSDEQSGNGRPSLYNIRSITEDYISTLKGSDLDRYMKQCLCGRVGESSMLTLKPWTRISSPVRMD